MKLAWILALGLSLTGCEPDPWQTFPIGVEPDQQCRTGHETGYDVYLWHCYQSQRVAIFRHCSAFFGCDPSERQTAACSSTTPIERDLKLQERCDAVPVAVRWVPGTPESPVADR